MSKISDTSDIKELCRALFAEFLAMTLFIFFGTGSVAATGEFLTQDGVARENTVGRLMPIAMSFGMSIMVLAYGFGDFSGGHINPAVTFFVFLIRKMTALRSILYLAAQLCGATLGSLLVWAATEPMSGVGAPPFDLGANRLNADIEASNGFLFEMMGTFLLCITVLLTAVKTGGASDGEPNLAPLCIGFSVFLAHVVLIPFTGCGINPARTFGPALVNSFAGNDVWDTWSWIYYVGPACGAMLAAGCHFILLDNDRSDYQAPKDNYHVPKEQQHRRSYNGELSEKRKSLNTAESVGKEVDLPPTKDDANAI